MKYRGGLFPAAYCAVGIGCAAGLWWTIWVLVTGPLAHLVHSPFQTFFAVLTITIVCVSLVAGVLVGAWDSVRLEPRRHRPFLLRTLPHH